jgi:hypothetical protein
VIDGGPAAAPAAPASVVGAPVVGAPVVGAAASGGGSLRSPTGLLALWDDVLLPLARTMLPTVQAAIDGFGPDVVVADQQALAGAAGAHVAGVPWATIVPTSAGLVDPLWDMPKVRQRVRRQVRGFLGEAGLDDVAAARIDPQVSPHLVIACTTEALAGPVVGIPGRCALVGPCLDPPRQRTGGGRADRGDRGDRGDRERPDPSRPLVVLALESPDADSAGRFRRAAIDAMSTTLAVRTAIVEPTDPPERLHRLVRSAAAVICDGGHGALWAALAEAVPLVVVPLTGDQPLVAEQVVGAGAGIRVPARSVDAGLLRNAISTVLAEERIRRGAQRVRASLAAARGAPAAADHLEELLVPVAPPEPGDLVDPTGLDLAVALSSGQRHRHLVAL